MTPTATRVPSRMPLPSACFALLALLISSCSSTEKSSTQTVDLAANAVASAGELRDELVALQTQVDVTAQAMASVVAATDKGSVFPWRRRTADGELNPAYEKFTAELNKLKKQYEQTNARSKRFKEDAQKHVDAWKQQIAQIENPDLKKTSEKRYNEAAERVEAANAGIDETRSDYLSYQKELEEIQTTLGLDLNEEGVLTLEKVIDKATERSKGIEGKIGKIVQSTDDLIKAMSSK